MPEDYQVQDGDCVSSIAYSNGFYWETLWNHPGNASLKSDRKDPNILKAGDLLHIPDLTVRQEPGATEATHKFKLKGVPAKLRMRLMKPKEDPSQSSGSGAGGGGGSGGGSAAGGAGNPAGAGGSTGAAASESASGASSAAGAGSAAGASSASGGGSASAAGQGGGSGAGGPAALADSGGGDDDDSSYEDPDFDDTAQDFEPRANVPYILEIDGNTTRGTTDGDGHIEETIPPSAQSGTLTLNPGAPNELKLPLALGGIDPIAEITGVRKRLSNLGYPCLIDGDQMTDDLDAALRQFQAANGLTGTGQIDDPTKDKLQSMHGC